MGELINCPKLSIDDFFGIQNGTRVFNHGYDQCVALANQYHEGTLNGYYGYNLGSAYQWWTEFNNVPGFVEKYTQVTDNPQRGDIFIGRYGLYQAANGHIGVVERSWDGSTFGTMEQNAGSGDARWVWRYNRNMNNILGFLRPKENIPPAPVIDTREEDMYAKLQFADGDAEVWNMATGELGHIDTVEDWLQLDANMKSYKFNSRADFDNFNNKYPFRLKTTTVNAPAPTVDVSAIVNELASKLSINVDALATAIAAKINANNGVTSPEVPDITTKEEILAAIQTNYPEDK